MFLIFCMWFMTTREMQIGVRPKEAKYMERCQNKNGEERVDLELYAILFLCVHAFVSIVKVVLRRTPYLQFLDEKKRYRMDHDQLKSAIFVLGLIFLFEAGVFTTLFYLANSKPNCQPLIYLALLQDLCRTWSFPGVLLIQGITENFEFYSLPTYLIESMLDKAKEEFYHT